MLYRELGVRQVFATAVILVLRNLQHDRIAPKLILTHQFALLVFHFVLHFCCFLLAHRELVAKFEAAFVLVEGIAINQRIEICSIVMATIIIECYKRLCRITCQSVSLVIDSN